MSFIILTAEEADAVRGETSPGHALDPVPLKDGTFALPARVLEDPAHERRHAALAPLPQRTIAGDEWEGGDAE